MEITQVRVFPVDEEKLKAFVSIVIDECFVVSDIKIIEGPSGLFISMPSKKRKNGTFRDIAHPLNSETRHRIEERIIGHYRTMVGTGDRAEEFAGRGLEAPRGNGRPDGGGTPRASEKEPWGDAQGPDEDGGQPSWP